MDLRMNDMYRKRNRKPRKPENTERRIRANMRERARVSEMNGMFKVLIDLLPPSPFKARLSRAQTLREAASYIFRLLQYLASPEDINAFEKFPHIFATDREITKIPNRRSCNINEDGGVSAFISRHDLSSPPTIQCNDFSRNMVPVIRPTPIIHHQTTMYPVLPPTNVFISAYF